MMDNRFINAEHLTSGDRKRLEILIHKYKKSGVILLSGDVHHAQVIGSGCKHPSLGYELVEVTSSGMTHTCDRNLAGLCHYGMKGNTPATF